MFFNSDQTKQLTEEFSKIESKYNKLLLKFTSLKLQNSEAYEYAYHGFTRRIGTLKRCIENTYTICPPNQSEKLSRSDLLDLGINLQSFVFNIYGCMDNLAWIWAKEKQLKDKKGKPLSGIAVGLMSLKNNKIVREHLSKDFQQYLDNLKKENKGEPNKWYDNLEDFRHALAHRIPLYVPPYGITSENAEKSKILEAQMQEALKKHDFEGYNSLNTAQDDLGHFLPIMTHSISKSANRVVFHSQVLADWNTIVEMSEKFLEEL